MCLCGHMYKPLSITRCFCVFISFFFISAPPLFSDCDSLSFLSCASQWVVMLSYNSTILSVLCVLCVCVYPLPRSRYPFHSKYISCLYSQLNSPLHVYWLTTATCKGFIGPNIPQVYINCIISQTAPFPMGSDRRGFSMIYSGYCISIFLLQ